MEGEINNNFRNEGVHPILVEDVEEAAICEQVSSILNDNTPATMKEEESIFTCSLEDLPVRAIDELEIDTGKSSCKANTESTTLSDIEDEVGGDPTESSQEAHNKVSLILRIYIHF